MTDAASEAAPSRSVGVPQGILGRVQSEFKIEMGTLKFGVVGRGTLFWEWMIGREGVCRWTHQRGKEGSGREDGGWRFRLESDPVKVVLIRGRDQA